MNLRRMTKGLTTAQVKELNEAWHHAQRVGLPLNTFVTFRPFREMTDVEHCEHYAAIRNKVGIYARQRGFTPAFVWSRESNPDGYGEHLHMLIHVPRRFREHFLKTVIGWDSDPAAIVVKDADQKTVMTDDGYVHSAIGYLSKQMDNRARWRRGLRPQKPGPILGKRAGISATLNQKARDAFLATDRARRAA
jgi:hypothetical protein